MSVGKRVRSVGGALTARFFRKDYDKVVYSRKSIEVIAARCFKTKTLWLLPEPGAGRLGVGMSGIPVSSGDGRATSVQRANLFIFQGE